MLAQSLSRAYPLSFLSSAPFVLHASRCSRRLTNTPPAPCPSAVRPQTKISSKCLDYSHLQHVSHIFRLHTAQPPLYVRFPSRAALLNRKVTTFSTPPDSLQVLTTWSHENETTFQTLQVPARPAPPCVAPCTYTRQQASECIARIWKDGWEVVHCLSHKRREKMSNLDNL